jgi:hypothetical protein
MLGYLELVARLSLEEVLQWAAIAACLGRRPREMPLAIVMWFLNDLSIAGILFNTLEDYRASTEMKGVAEVRFHHLDHFDEPFESYSIAS